jgi:predicted DNA-binding transcriptional regulator AlpA
MFANVSSIRSEAKQARISKAVSGFDKHPDSAQVDVEVVAALASISRATVYRYSKAGILPAPRKFGGSSRWNVGELRAALKAKG